MHHWFSGLFALLITLPVAPLVLAQGGCERVVISADPAYPPLHWYDGKQFRGASIELTTKALIELGIPYEIRYLGPWKRVLVAAENGVVDMVTTLKDTTERRQFLTFSTPVLSNPVAVFVRVEEPFPFTNKEDLIGRRGGIARGNRFGQPFDQFMDEQLQIEAAQNMETSFRMLLGHRFDYVLTGYYPALLALQTARWDANIVALRPFVIETPNLVGFVSKSPCVKYLKVFNDEIEKMRKNGDIERALRNANKEWRQFPVMNKP
ncbi:substrate-binding periplasmic protein [Undibacterium sp. RuRC25W]|uniref:substrate-binding periplasmic protein n=1 Tax=Undibacterium sp. RuRC25W TaxID=3413047 RepID=UPI003BF1780E